MVTPNGHRRGLAPDIASLPLGLCPYIVSGLLADLVFQPLCVFGQVIRANETGVVPCPTTGVVSSASQPGHAECEAGHTQ